MAKENKLQLAFKPLNANDVGIITTHGIAFQTDEKGRVFKAVSSLWKEELPILEYVPEVKLEVACNTPMYEAYQRGLLTGDKISFYALMGKNSDDNFILYKLLMESLLSVAIGPDGKIEESKMKYPLYNPKKKHGYVCCGSRQAMINMFGSDVLGASDNPLKVFPLVSGNSAFVYDAETTEEWNGHAPSMLKVLITAEEYLHEHPVAPGCTMFHDGCIHWKVGFKIKKWSQRDTDNWFSVFGTQSRTIIPALGKFKGNSDSTLAFETAVRCGYEHLYEQVDGVASISVLKSWPQDWKPGQIVEIPMNNFRIVQAKVSDGNSSIGGQASARLDFKSTEALLREHGAHERAKILRDAIRGKASAYQHILKADKDNTLGDAVKEYIQYLAFASDDGQGDWQCPMYESAWNHAMARMYSYYFRNVIKCPTAKVSLYVQVDPKLDKAEEKHFDETGERVNFVKWPRIRKIRSMLNQHRFQNVGRNPMVGPGNAQQVIHLLDDKGAPVWNPTTDTIYVSARMLYSMFGDEDGDAVIMIPSNNVAFPVVRRPAGAKKSFESKYVQPTVLRDMDPWDIVDKLMDVTYMTVQAAMDTGSADLISRLVVITYKLIQQPVSVLTLLEMAEFCELQIQKMKRKTGKTAQSDVGADANLRVRDAFIKKFWKKGKLNQGTYAPKEHILLCKNADLKGNPKESSVMSRIIFKLANMIPFDRTVPHHVVWDVLQGVKPSMEHAASDRIQKFFAARWNALVPYINSGGWTYVVPSVPTEEHKLWAAKKHLLNKNLVGMSDTDIMALAITEGFDASTLVASRRPRIDDVEAAIQANGFTLMDYTNEELKDMMDTWVPFEYPGETRAIELNYTIPLIKDVAKSIVEYYNQYSSIAKDIEDNYSRRIAFSMIKENIRVTIAKNAPVPPEEGWVRDLWGMTPLDYYYRAVLCRIGSQGFGLWTKKPDLESSVPVEHQKLNGSRGGSAFWYMPEQYLVDYALMMNPGNPWAEKAKLELIVLKRKSLEAEARRGENDDDEENVNY